MVWIFHSYVKLPEGRKLRYRCGLGLSIGIFVGFEWIFLDFNGMLGCYWDVNGMLVGFQTTQMVIYCIG
jgi:hypothetical protein